MADRLQLTTGDYVLLESGGEIFLEQSSPTLQVAARPLRKTWTAKDLRTTWSATQPKGSP